LEKIKGREHFIQTGLKELHENKLDKCPFCEQELKLDEEYLHVIKEYEKVFDNEFTKTQVVVEQTLNSYKNLLLSLLRSSEPLENRVRLETSNKLLSREDKLENLVLEQSRIDKIQQEIRAVDEKLKNILTKYEKSGIDEIAKIVASLNQVIIVYNQTVKTINDAIDKTKKELGTGDVKKQKDELSGKIRQNEKKLFVLKNFVSLSNIRVAESKYGENKKKIAVIKTILDAFIEKVKKKFKEFVDTYFGEIEKYVGVFCPSIEVKIVSPRVTYDLKQSVAIAYFLALLSKTRNKDQKIVVFDDPINSFDAGRRKMCAEYILKEVIAFKQSFVLTCDPLFRTYIRKAIGRKFGSERMEYYVLRSASSSIHHRNDNQATIYAIFKTDFRNIDSVLGTDENIIIFGQKLRYCIEEVKDKYLGYGHDSLDNILTQVKGSNFEKFKNSIDDLMEIYTYCNTGGLAHYPRDGKTSWDELKLFIKRYLKLGI
jgi:wobble nucleotide-excising tRNase